MQIECKNSFSKDDLTRKIDHILFTEWDPIGVSSLSEYDCSDEYHQYLPTIVEMVRKGASFADISNQLMVFESYIYGDRTIRRRCDVIAVLVSSYGSHYASNPFIPTINTDTPEGAYQSVLDLVTQTRLDAYEKRWEAVCTGYEQAIDICNKFLPSRDLLMGTCLNNLGHAYSQLGQLEKARTQFEKALSKLLFDDTRQKSLYEICLNNLINNVKHRGEFDVAAALIKVLFSYRDNRCVRDEEEGSAPSAEEEKQRLEEYMRVDYSPEILKCTRMSVELDGGGQISSIIMIE